MQLYTWKVCTLFKAMSHGGAPIIVFPNAVLSGLYHVSAWVLDSLSTPVFTSSCYLVILLIGPS